MRGSLSCLCVLGLAGLSQATEPTAPSSRPTIDYAQVIQQTAGMVGEQLALKILPEELSEQPAFREQFLKEIRVAMRLVDKQIVQIRDVGVTQEGLLYYTMDLCPGTGLAQVLRQEG